MEAHNATTEAQTDELAELKDLLKANQERKLNHMDDPISIKGINRNIEQIRERINELEN